ncbi:glyoxalase [Gemmatimonadetes bacterium T265]|nr:glyoxalase [Gemmatimonadetes bacterium T265]
MSAVLGIHHVTAIASDPQRNLDFYAGLLGLRFVKRTVNFDDPQTYHLYYGDEVGTPGSVMTFFPWPRARRGRPGPGQVAVTSFAVPPSAVGFWVARLLRYGVAAEPPATRTFGGVAERVLAFRDPDGLLLELVAHPGAEARPAWADAPGVSAEHALRGFHGVTLWAEHADPTERVLADTLGFRALADADGVHRFEAGAGGVSTFVDVRAAGGFVPGIGGAGTVHHVAFRVPDDAAELAAREDLVAAGLHPTPQVDREYFRSVYFREPGGVLYELATDGPGFAVDEPVDTLGQALKLPPRYEPHRAQIEAVLPPIHLPVPVGAADLLGAGEGPEDVSGEALGFVHRYVPPSDAVRGARSATLLLLHGTGGDEEALLPLGRQLLPGAALLSPRGKALEAGMPRFFRRHAAGVLDQEDLARRTVELAEFVDRAAATYAFDRGGVLAVGFSNGANIAASLLLRRGAILRGAVLLSPMLPFEPAAVPDLRGTVVFIGAGRDDPLVPAAQVERLAEVFREAGAEVTVHWELGGHGVTAREIEAAHVWLARVAASVPAPTSVSTMAPAASTGAEVIA